MDDEQMREAMKGWAGGRPETECGPGSTMANTEKVRDILPAWISRYSIRTLADVGAGDLNWIRQVELGAVDYWAYDLIPRSESVAEYDLCSQALPTRFDAILCRHCLNHLSIPRVLAGLWNFSRVARFLIASQCSGETRPEHDVDGRFRRYDLRKPPFALGEPLDQVHDLKDIDLAIWRL